MNKIIVPILSLAFRPFFLGGCIFSVIAIALWWANLQGYVGLTIYGNWLWWHSHEMIFGFACAIIVGFLLTAVQNWTGVPGIKGKGLASLFALWLAARIAMFLPLPESVVVMLDAPFLLVAAAVFARPLVKVRMFRNMIFIVILLALTALNIASHDAVLNKGNPAPYFHAAIMLIVLIIAIMGGRVIPLFTRNALKSEAVSVPKIVDLSAIVSTLILVVFAVAGFMSVPVWLLGLVVLVSFLAHSYRLVCWFDKGILDKPILWSLHLAYAFIPLGLLLMLWQISGPSMNISLVLHSFTVGGIGGLILAMISRVALGHTGRLLVLPKLMPVALSILFIGGFMRTLLPWLNMSFYGLAIDGAALCWGLAFSGFVICYGPFLVTPRADGKLD